MAETKTVEPRLKKIVWAVDAFADDAALQAHTAQAVRAVSAGGDVTVEPVHVVHLGKWDPVAVRVPVESVAISPVALSRMEKIVGKVKLPGLAEPKILRPDHDSVRSAVKTLIEYADGAKADLIAVGTHGRKGAARFFVGSFAETLILQTPLPVLVCNPKAKATRKVGRILFPTDFSPQSAATYGRVLALAKRWKAEVQLFHKLEYLLPIVDFPFVMPPAPPVRQDGDLARESKGLGAGWAEKGKAQGVKVTFHLAKNRGDTAAAIERTAAKLRSDIIAMASESGPLESALVGSVTRQVLRAASCPVLVLHPDGARARVQPTPPRRREERAEPTFS